MAAVHVSSELSQTGDKACPKGIEMEITDEFQQVWFFIDNNGFVPVLEKVSTPAVAPVKGPGVASQEGAHHPGEGAFACANEQVKVVREENPSINNYRSGLGETGQAPYKIIAILVILWLLGMISSYTVGGLIHILLVLAIIAVLVRIIQGRRPI